MSERDALKGKTRIVWKKMQHKNQCFVLIMAAVKSSHLVGFSGNINCKICIKSFSLWIPFRFKTAIRTERANLF